MGETTSKGVPTMQYADHTTIVRDVPERKGELLVEYPTRVGAYSPATGRPKFKGCLSQNARNTEKNRKNKREFWFTPEPPGSRRSQYLYTLERTVQIITSPEK
jgi:hypothetical protein